MAWRRKPRALLRKAAKNAGVELLLRLQPGGDGRPLKTELLDRLISRGCLSISAVRRPTWVMLKRCCVCRAGLLPAPKPVRAGNGVIGYAMRNDIPVIHMLNVKSISNQVGIPYDSQPRKKAPSR